MRKMVKQSAGADQGLRIILAVVFNSADLSGFWYLTQLSRL